WIEGGAKPTSGTAMTQHDIIPVLLRHCTVCHGLRRREADLDLRTKSAMLRGGKSGSAIVPSKPEASLIIKKIRAGQMPPRDRLQEVSVKPIEQAEIQTLARWIAAAAPEVASEPDNAPTIPHPPVRHKERDHQAVKP